MSKRLNKKTLTNSLAVDSKHDVGDDVFDQDRYWVNKDRFWEFQKEYDKLQDEKQNPMTVEMNIIVELKTMEEFPKFLSKDAFIPITTAYGGMEGVKMYIKKLVINSVYAWEDSGTEIIKMI